MHTLNIIKTIKKISANDIRDFIFENYYKQIGVSKEESCCSLKRLKKEKLLFLANKLIKNRPNPCNAKKHYESFLRKKNRKPVKKSEIIAYQPKTL